MAYNFWIHSSIYMEKRIKAVIYFVMKNIASIALRFYYRGIERNGLENIPENGVPFIYAVNHQNALMDAVIVGGLSPIPTYFMTRSDVFKPPFDWFLDALKMMPIYRIRDGYGSLHRNDAIFETCRDILAESKAILIFPEGNHGLEYYLRTLTKGISRIALQSQITMEQGIRIVPVGLNYFDHFNSGNKLIINYGTPIEVKDYLDLYAEHHQKGLRKITKDISIAMRKTLVIPSDNPAYPTQKRIFSRRNEELNFRQLKEGLDEPELTQVEKNKAVFLTLGRIFGLLNFPPLQLNAWIINNKVKQKIFNSSIKIASAIIIFPIWFLLCFIVLLIWKGLLWAISFFALQIITLLIRRELVRLGR